MRKAQLSVFVIIGLLIMLAISIYLSNPLKIESSVIEFSSELGKLNPYFRECCKLSMLDANARYGIHSSTKDDYETYLIAKVDECMSPFLNDIAARGMDVEKINTPSSQLEINELNAVATIKYPVKVSTNSDSFVFPDYVQEFEKVTMIDNSNIENAVSTDTNFILSTPPGIKIYGAYNEPVDIMYIKVADKNEIGCKELLSNLVYGIYPYGYYTDKPVTVKFDIDKLAPWLTNRDELKIAWQDPDSKKCTFIQASDYKDGILEVKTDYLTFFGVGKPNDPTSGFLPQSEGEGSPGANFNTPAGEFGTFPAPAQEMYNAIQADMGGTYPLFKNNACVPPGAFCFTGWSKSCNGEVGIYCNDRIYSMGEDELNTLFRHEITHNLQQLACPGQYEPDYSEWGAEYYSGSSYYRFAIKSSSGEEAGLSAAEAGKRMEEGGCSEEELLDAAFCKGGYSLLSSKCGVTVTGHS